MSGIASGAATGAAAGSVVPGLGTLAGAAIGGIAGGILANGDQNAAGADYQQALQNYQNIVVPTIGEQQWNLANEQAAGTLTPQALATYNMGPNALANITTNPAYTQAQQQQLAALQQLGAGGLTAQEQQNLIQSQQAAAGQAQSQNAAILQQMGARGMGGSGAQLAAQLSNSQNSANQASNNANSINTMAQQNALGAMSGAGGLASQLQQAQFGQQAAVAQAQNAINQFNTQNQQQVAGYNTQAANQAQASNLANAQNIANTNTNLANQTQEHNTGLYQQQFNNQIQQASGEAGALGAQGTYNQNQANATRGEFSGIGAAAGDAIAAGAAGSGNSSSSNSTSSQQPPNLGNLGSTQATQNGDANAGWAHGGKIPSNQRYAQGGQVQMSPQQMQQLQQAQSMAATGGAQAPMASQGLSPQQLQMLQSMIAQKAPVVSRPALPVQQPLPPQQAMARGGQVQSDLSPEAAEKLGHFIAKLAGGGDVIGLSGHAGNIKLPSHPMAHMANGGQTPNMIQHFAGGGMTGSLAQLAPLALAVLSKGGRVPEHNQANLGQLQNSFNRFISEEKQEPRKMYEGGNLTGLPHAPSLKKSDSNDMNQSYADGGSVQNSGGLSPEAKQQILASLANTFSPTPVAAPKQYAQGALPNAEDAAAYGQAATMSPAEQAELAQTQAAMAKFRAANNMPADTSLPNPNNNGMSKGGITHSALDVGMAMVRGGGVPGRAPVKGDSPKNDIVDAKLSPGEIVIPRSKVNKSDDEIMDFVKKAREGKRK